MKEQDLRIGNYVQLYGKQVKVLEIWDTALKTTDIRTNCAYFIDQYNPIQLTEETLLKCGFKHNKLNNSYENETRISIYVNDNFFFCQIDNVVIKDIYYLHQLQNLYYILIGKELNYETN